MGVLVCVCSITDVSDGYWLLDERDLENKSSRRDVVLHRVYT